MSKITFTKEQQTMLLNNKYVEKCTSKYIVYSPEFKEYAVTEYLNGKTPIEIFTEAGFDLKVIGSRRAKESLNRWRRIHRQHGMKALKERIVGHGSKGRPLNTPMTDKEKIERLELEVKFLKAEKDFLVKLRAKRGWD